MNYKKLLKIWKEVWSKSTKLNPMPAILDAELDKHDLSIYDINTALAFIMSKKTPLSKDEQALIHFYNRTKAAQQAALIDATTMNGNLAGSMFMLKTKHGFSETQKVEQTNTTKVVMDWGDDESSKD